MRRAALLLLVVAACRQDMHDQPRYEPLEASTFFADGRASRPRIPGTVARGELRLDTHLYKGKVDGKPATTFPFEITMDVMRRGQERFNIFCAACHGKLGDGQGMIVKRGMKQPTSYHDKRLRESPPGYFFDVITNGFGAMYDLSYAITPRDRWAIVAYVRALQRSQNATLDDIASESERARLEKDRVK